MSEEIKEVVSGDDHHQCLSNDLILAKILEYMSYTELKNCALVNWKWNQEAVKFIHRRSYLQIGNRRISEHLKFVKNGVPIHPNIWLYLASFYTCDYSLRAFRASRAEKATFLQWVQLFGSNVKKATLVLDQTGRSLSEEQYRQVFSKMSNIEYLKIDIQVENPDWILKLRSCTPQNCVLDSLKSFRFEMNEDYYDGEEIDWTTLKKKLRPFLAGLLATATNLSKLSDDNGVAVSLALSEINKMTEPYGDRLGTIEEIDTTPRTSFKRILLNGFQKFASLRKVTFTVNRSNTWTIQPILDKYKDIWTYLSLQYQDLLQISEEDPDLWNDNLILPNMTQLKKLVLEFGTLAVFYDNDDDDAISGDTTMFPEFQFHPDEGALVGVAFYPELKEIKAKIKDDSLAVDLIQGLFPVDSLFEDQVGAYTSFFPKVERLVICQDWDEFTRNNNFSDLIGFYLPNCHELDAEEVNVMR